MMKNNIENQVVDIDGYIHVINGKVICFKPDVFDLNNSDDVNSLFKFLESLFASSHLKLLYGEQTMYYFGVDSDGNSICVGMGDLEVFLTNFSENVQKKIRLEILKQKNQIVDIDGYVHVINGKVICFKSDVYDLNNLKHIEDLIHLSELMCHAEYGDYRAYGDDTIMFVDRSSFCESSVYMESGDLVGLPEDYRKKIEGVLNNFC